jgi:hypothetical protein
MLRDTNALDIVGLPSCCSQEASSIILEIGGEQATSLDFKSYGKKETQSQSSKGIRHDTPKSVHAGQ